ncbi:MAG: TIGR02147 family protein [Pseudobdellovibrionaceae bacterium]
MNQLQSIGAVDFRTFLEQELNRRNSLNPNYSLRAFARDLSVDSSFLSKLLSGKRSMTVRTIMSLAPRLNLSKAEAQAYSQKAYNRRRRYLSGGAAPVFQEIENEKFLEMIEWYHLAILELVTVQGFDAKADWVAERLKIPVEQAQGALDDLINVGMLFQDEGGCWKCEVSNHTISSKKAPRTQLLKKQIYEQALAALPQQEGSHGTITVAISERRYEEAVERIVKFRRELSQFLSEPHEKDKVYQMVISLFPISG